MIIKRTELYDLVSQYCRGEYAIGLHGVDYSRMDKLVKCDDHDKGLNNIIENGLNVFSSRSIHGTVKFFGRIDVEEDKEKVKNGLEKYMYFSKDYIIVAIPIIFRRSTGKEIFLGSPNLDTRYKKFIGSKGNEKTTLLDYLILENPYNRNVIKSEFLLGKFKLLEDGNIDFYLNKNHISFKNGIVQQELFDMIETKLNNILRFYSIDVDATIFEKLNFVDTYKAKELISKIHEKIINKTDNSHLLRSDVVICETLEQLLNEKNLTKRNIEREVPKQLINNIENINNTNVHRFNTSDKKIHACLNKGKYYIVDNQYYVDFCYPSIESAIPMMQIIDRLNFQFGVKSKRVNPGNNDYIMPYLIDASGNFTVDYKTAKGIGGTNIPMDLLADFIKIFIEQANCVIDCGDKTMEEKFSQEIFDSMMNYLDSGKLKENKNIKL